MRKTVRRAAAAKPGCALSWMRRNEKIGYKIRQARNERIPYMLVIGDREAEAGQVAVRKRGEGEMGDMALEDFLAMAQAQVESKEIF